MSDVQRILREVAAQEANLRRYPFLAPCIPGAHLRARVGGLLLELAADPPDFEGWGIFRARDPHTAERIEEAALPRVAAYLALLRPLRVRLAVHLRGQTWLAYPSGESDTRQRLGRCAPLPVHLVRGAAAFDPIVARWDGSQLWFEEVDRRADATEPERLAAALGADLPTASLRWKGLTPETRQAYDVAFQRTAAGRARRQAASDEARVREALERGGGRLERHLDQGDHWTVEWTTRDGVRHVSAVAKGDLTVVSAGICLSGRDRDFDLQSLVGVIEGIDA